MRREEKGEEKLKKGTGKKGVGNLTTKSFVPGFDGYSLSGSSKTFHILGDRSRV